MKLNMFSLKKPSSIEGIYELDKATEHCNSFTVKMKNSHHKNLIRKKKEKEDKISNYDINSYYST